MKRLLYLVLGIVIISANTVYALPYFRSDQTIIPFQNNAYELGTSTAYWRNLFTNQICLAGDCKTAWPTGGGGSGGGTFSTTTSTVAGQLINYPNNATDIVTIGSNSTTTGEFWFDPNIPRSFLTYASSTGLTAVTGFFTNLFIGADTIAEYISDTAGAFFTGNTETGVTVTYQDADNTVDVVCDTASASTFGCLTSAFFSKFNSATTTFTSPLTYTLGTNAVTLDTTGTWSGNAGTATALAANGANCSAGSYPLGVDANGAVESCTVAGSGGISDPFTHPATGQSATTSLMLLYGNASTTQLSANIGWFNYIKSTSTATSTFAGGIDMGANHLVTHGVQSDASDGLHIHAGNGQTVGLFGAGNTTNSLFYGGVNIDGATRLATSLSGLALLTSGTVSAITNGTAGYILSMSAGTPTWVATTTFSGGLTYANGNVTCTGCSGSVTYDAWSHPFAGSSATTSLMLLYGQASTTLFSANTAFFNFFNATGTTATSTITNALQIGSTAGDNQLKITAGRNYPASDSVGGQVNVTGTNNLGSLLTLYTNAGVGRLNDVLRIKVDNALNDQRGLSISNDGTRSAALFDCTNATRVTGGECVTITDVAGANRTTLGVSGAPIGLGLLKFTVDSGADANASALAVRLDDTDPQGIFMDTVTGYTGKFLNIRNDGTELLTMLSSGNLGLSTSSPYAKLSVVGDVVASNFVSTTTSLNIFPYASSTAFSTGYASSTSWYGGGLTTCSGSNFLQWSGGLFACGTPSAGAVTYDAWTHSALGRSATTSSLQIATTTPWLNSIFTAVGTTTIKGQLNSLTSSTTASTVQNIDWSTGNTQSVMLTANTHININATSSNPIDGGSYKIKICQDPTGSRTVTWGNPANLRWWNGTTTITSTANRCTWVGMIYTAQNGNNIYNVIASSTNLLIN